MAFLGRAPAFLFDPGDAWHAQFVEVRLSRGMGNWGHVHVVMALRAVRTQSPWSWRSCCRLNFVGSCSACVVGALLGLTPGVACVVRIARACAPSLACSAAPPNGARNAGPAAAHPPGCIFVCSAAVVFFSALGLPLARALCWQFVYIGPRCVFRVRRCVAPCITHVLLVAYPSAFDRIVLRGVLLQARGLTGCTGRRIANSDCFGSWAVPKCRCCWFVALARGVLGISLLLAPSVCPSKLPMAAA